MHDLMGFFFFFFGYVLCRLEQWHYISFSKFILPSMPICYQLHHRYTMEVQGSYYTLEKQLSVFVEKKRNSKEL